MRAILLLTIGSVAMSSIPAFGVSIFVKDEAGFNAAVTALTNLGTEDFESSTAGSSIVTFDDSLAPGVANGPFPSGSLAALGMTIQSNMLGGAPATLSPRGAFGLASIGGGAAGTPTDQIGNQVENDSLDFIFSPVAQAVGLNPTFAFNNTVSDPNGIPGDLEIRIYDSSNVLLATQTFTGIGYAATDHFGVVAMPGEDIGRINLFATTGDFTGADNITVFGPGAAGPGLPDSGTTGALFAGALLSLAAARKGRPGAR